MALIQGLLNSLPGVRALASAAASTAEISIGSAGSEAWTQLIPDIVLFLVAVEAVIKIGPVLGRAIRVVIRRDPTWPTPPPRNGPHALAADLTRLHGRDKLRGQVLAALRDKMRH